jgi:hypothetical protein
MSRHIATRISISLIEASRQLEVLQTVHNSELAPSSLAQWTSAIGTCFAAFLTFVAVCIALFKDSYLSHRRRPILVPICKNESPWTVKIRADVYNLAGNHLWSGPSYWARIEIINHGRTRADKLHRSVESREGTGFPTNISWHPFSNSVTATIARNCRNRIFLNIFSD